MKDLGLEHGYSVQTPATHDATEEEVRAFGSSSAQQVQDASDNMFAVQSRSSGRNIHGARVVSKDVKHSTTEPCQVEEACHMFETRVKYSAVEGWSKKCRHFSGSDWAGCKETRRAPSAGVILLGNHTLKTYTRKHNIIARNSAEAESCMRQRWERLSRMELCRC